MTSLPSAKTHLQVGESLRRRQSSSCDQCRQGKRACDASRTVLALDTIKESMTMYADLADVLTDGERARCSYCRRTGKNCTFKWLTSVIHRKKQAKIPRGLEVRNHKKIRPSGEADIADAQSQKSSEEHSSGFSETNGSDDADADTAFPDAVDFEMPGEEHFLRSNIDHRLCQQDAKTSITRNLIRVYQDSMENALDCWLTESNCPYTAAKSLCSSPFQNTNFDTETRTKIPNRILQKICQLDRDFRVASLANTSLSEQKRADKALRLAMMSFATQWSQSGPRERAEYRLNMSDGSNITSVNPPASPLRINDGSFGRSMQEVLWYQARDALLDAESILSSRVAFAFIIFSLTQRPLPVQANHAQDVLNVSEIVDLDGPPIFLESAMRQLSKMRRMVQRDFAYQMNGNNHPLVESKRGLDNDSRETFDLLFWLGVMFDTLSAAMHGRAVIVADDDRWDLATHTKLEIDLDGWNISPTDGSETIESLWENRLIAQNGIEAITWPCSESVAEKVLRDAAPVKVLFFRKVAKIQALLSRNAPSFQIEAAIDNGLVVYSYWQKMFQPFIISCINYHENLSPKLQSWYGILSGHFHLAAMILGDVVEQIDAAQISAPTKRLARKRSVFVESWRLEHASAVSDIADAALREEYPSFAQSPVFHHAIRKSALLSEPWTAILTRTFSRAAMFLLEMMSKSTQVDEVQEFSRRARRCIEALLLIGKKSDIAMLAAEKLRSNYFELRDNCQHMEELQSAIGLEDPWADILWQYPSGTVGL